MILRRAIAALLICAAMLAGLGPSLADAEPDWAAPPGEPDPGAAARQAFGRYCAACHAGPAAGSEEAPANFMNPAAGSRMSAIALCAERIAFRLALWDWPEALRPVPPMPPADWLAGDGIDPAAWATGEARAALRVFMAGLLALTGSSSVRVEQTGSLDYERLRPCLAEDAP